MLNFLLPAHLNSIMFLLILHIVKPFRICPFDFKFHYVSINSNFNSMFFSFIFPLNSIMFLLILRTALNTVTDAAVFKFHYVSINSLFQVVQEYPQKPLNSIMFLLIREEKIERALKRYPLNSIMFLLIQIRLGETTGI